MCSDIEGNEMVQIYLYDYIAFAISEQNLSNPNHQYYRIFEFLVKKLKNDYLHISVSDLMKIYAFTISNGLPKELKDLLWETYWLNEAKRKNKYQIDYKYYSNKNEHNMLIEFSKVITNLINDNLSRLKKYSEMLSKIHDNARINSYNNSNYDESLLENENVFDNKPVKKSGR
jgi:hypothetical protein